MAKLIYTSYAPIPTVLTVVDGMDDTGMVLLKESEWGNVVFSSSQAGSRSTRGARHAAGIPENRPVVLALRVTGATKDVLNQRIGAIGDVIDEMRRFGGRVTWQSNNQSYRQHLEVLGGVSRVTEWGHRYEANNTTIVICEFSCEPYAHGDPMNIADPFDSSSTLTDNWTIDAGGPLSVSGGSLVPANTDAVRLRHTGTGYQVADKQVVMQFTTGTSLTTWEVGIILRGVSGSQYVSWVWGNWGQGAYLNSPSGAVISGSSTGTLPTVTANTTYWIRARSQGDLIIAEVWTTRPVHGGTPAYTHTATVGATQNLARVPGFAGIRFIAGDTSWRVNDFQVEPYNFTPIAYPNIALKSNPIPGDAPALADVSVTAHNPGGVGGPPIFALIGWTPRPPLTNYVWNGDFELRGGPIGVDAGWFTTDISGNVHLNAGATLAFPEGGFQGKNRMEITSTTSANTGAQFRMHRTFRKGVKYTLRIWWQTTGTSWQARLGTLGTEHGSVMNLSANSSAGNHFTTTWTPNADYTSGLVNIRDTSTTVSTVSVDAIEVYEGTVPPTLPTQIEGRGAYPMFGTLQAEESVTPSGPPVADSNAWNGYKMSRNTANSTAGSMRWYVDPSTLYPDDYTQKEAVVEVWARVNYDSRIISPNVNVSLLSEDSRGEAIVTDEHGTAGKTLTPILSSTAWRFIRVGTLRVRVDRAKPRRMIMTLTTGNATGSAGNFDVDYLLMVPAKSRALSPTGKNLDGYPKFINILSLTTKTINSDLSGEVSVPPNHSVRDHGLGGSPIELPPGDVDLLLKLSTLVPDNPVISNDSEGTSHTPTVSVAVTPRWRYLRY